MKAVILLPLILSLTSCVVAGGSGNRWAYASLGTDSTALSVGAASLNVASQNQSTTVNGVGKTIRDQTLMSKGGGVLTQAIKLIK